MKDLITHARQAIASEKGAPFSVYHAIKEQTIINVPITKPLLICVLDGTKRLGVNSEVICDSGEFVFLSNNPQVHLRNIPRGAEYFALLIEFELSDFECLPSDSNPKEPMIKGKVNDALYQSLLQFVDCASYLPDSLWASRRQELLQIFQHEGFPNPRCITTTPDLIHQVYRLVSTDLSADMSSQWLAAELALSESTLRRKLRVEGTSVQEIKDRVKLGTALHLIQTTFESIGIIAERCGYQSQSRFTGKFKQRFGITPTALRKTRMPD